VLSERELRAFKSMAVTEAGRSRKQQAISHVLTIVYTIDCHLISAGITGGSMLAYNWLFPIQFIGLHQMLL
jgi:hypothetical protein